MELEDAYFPGVHIAAVVKPPVVLHKVGVEPLHGESMQPREECFLRLHDLAIVSP